MKLRTKLTLGILVAAAVPLAIAGFSGARLSEGALRKRIEATHLTLATNLATGVQQFFGHKADALRVVPQLTDLKTATPELVVGLLRVAYRSTEDFAIVALLDNNGKELVDSVYLTDPKDDLSGRPAVDAANLAAFLKRVPTKRALADEHAVGRVEVTRTGSRCAVAIAFTANGVRYVIAADVSLARIDAQLSDLSMGEVKATLVDQNRTAVAGSLSGPRSLPLPGDDLSGLPKTPTVATVELAGEPTLAGFAPAVGTGLGVLVVHSENAAFAHVRALRKRTLWWLGASALLAVLAGVLLAAGLSRRVAVIAGGTAALAKGEFETRLDESGSDELAELARSFNRMAHDLDAASIDIRQKNQEIMRWNEQLEARVAQKSNELERAQDMVLRSRSLAAVGTLGAGLAHEINNPLTAVLGSAQLLGAEAKEGSRYHNFARDIEKGARRIRDIVVDLLALADSRPNGKRVALNLNKVVSDVVSLIGVDLRNENIDLTWKEQGDLPQIMGNAQRLQEAIMELTTNARRAMPTGGQLSLAVATTQKHAVSLRVNDDGSGVSEALIDKVFDPFFTTKVNWESTGMGLTLVHQIMEEHDGKVDFASTKEKGTTVTLLFPARSSEAHLE